MKYPCFITTCFGLLSSEQVSAFEAIVGTHPRVSLRSERRKQYDEYFVNDLFNARAELSFADLHSLSYHFSISIKDGYIRIEN